MTLPFGSSGDYRSWAEAQAVCSGDEPPEYRVKAMAAALKVANGQAVHVRDGILFDKIVYSWPCLAGLMYVAARHGGRLRIVDFGGGPAVSYLQNRRFIGTLDAVDWRIVERAEYCAFGRQQMPLRGVSYYETLDEACAAGAPPDAILLSAVLMMMEEPYALLREIRGKAIPHILIDRTSMSLEGRDRLTIYRAGAAHNENMSYPNWYLDERHVIEEIGPDYELIERFEAFSNPAPFPSERAGYIFSRRDIKR